MPEGAAGYEKMPPLYGTCSSCELPQAARSCVDILLDRHSPLQLLINLDEDLVLLGLRHEVERLGRRNGSLNPRQLGICERRRTHGNPKDETPSVLGCLQQ